MTPQQPDNHAWTPVKVALIGAFAALTAAIIVATATLVAPLMPALLGPKLAQGQPAPAPKMGVAGLTRKNDEGPTGGPQPDSAPPARPPAIPLSETLASWYFSLGGTKYALTEGQGILNVPSRRSLGKDEIKVCASGGRQGDSNHLLWTRDGSTTTVFDSWIELGGPGVEVCKGYTNHQADDVTLNLSIVGESAPKNGRFSVAIRFAPSQ